MKGRLLLLLGLLASLAVLIGVGAGTRPAATPAGRVVPVEGVAPVCPQVRRVAAEGLQTRVPAGVASSGTGAVTGGSATGGSDAGGSMNGGPANGGSVTAQPLDGAVAPVAVPLTGAGSAVDDAAAALAPAGDGAPAVVLTASGPAAGGLSAAQVTLADSGPRRGAAAIACAPPGTDWWFAGGSVAGGASSTLELVDPEAVDAVVDVQVWSDQGAADPRLGAGTVVPAHGRTSIALDTLAPGGGGLAVHVHAARGRVAAAVEHLAGPGGGVEWVPPSGPPATRVVLPGLPAGPGPRSVLVTNPGPDPAVVSVQLTTADGQFVPTGLDALTVPAGSTVTADLTTALATTPATVAVRSVAGPVLAVGVAVDGPAGSSDLSYAGAAPPLNGPAVVTTGGLPTGATAASRLLLSALATDASVLVTPLAAAGDAPAGPAFVVAVPGGSTVAVPLPAGAVAVQVAPAPGSGPVRAVAALRDDPPAGARTTLLALSAGPQLVRQPPVVDDPAAALP